MEIRERGQSLLEMILIIPVIALVLAGTYGIGIAAYRRTECSRLVFEGVHSAVHDSRRTSRVTLSRTESGIEGRLVCGTHTETLFLPYLEKRNSGVSRSPFSSSP